MGIRNHFQALKEKRRIIQEQEKVYRDAYRKAYEEEKLKRLPNLAKRRVKREMEVRGRKPTGGQTLKNVRGILEAGNRLSEALVGKPGEQIPTQGELKKRRFI